MTLNALVSNAAVNVFLGTLPLLLTIAWGLFTQNQRLTRLENKVDAIDSKLVDVSERLTRVETRLEGKHVVLT